jgi:hypothetical protein
MEFEEIQERLKIITKTPIKLIPDDKMAKIRKDMAIKCPITKKWMNNLEHTSRGEQNIN